MSSARDARVHYRFYYRRYLDTRIAGAPVQERLMRRRNGERRGFLAREQLFADLPQRFDRSLDLVFGVGRSDREAQRTAVDRHRGKQGRRDQDAVLPQDIAGLDDVGYVADSRANNRK